MTERRKPFSLYQRAGVWYVRLWDEAANRYTSGKSTKETDRDKAAIKAAEMVKSGQIVTHDKDPLFSDALLHYWHGRNDLSHNYKKSTLRYIHKHVTPYAGFKKLRLSQVTPGKINRFSDDLEKEGLTPRAINRILQILKTFFNYAYTREYLHIDIAGRIIRKKETLKRRGELTPPEIFKIAELDWPDHRLKVAVLLGIFAGLRKGEILALRWQEVDFKTNYIHVRRNFTREYDDDRNPVFKEPKADSRREWPYMIFPELREALLKQWEETPFKGPDDLVLPNVWRHTAQNGVTARSHSPLADVTIKRSFTRILEAIGIDREEQKRRNLSFHSTRHSFTSFIDMSGSSKTAMSLTGHSTREMLENYSHANTAATVDHLQAANEMLNRWRRKSG